MKHLTGFLSTAGVIAITALLLQPAALATTNESSCAQYATFSVGGGYTVQNDAYNVPSGEQQCVYADSTGTDWYETSTATLTGGSPSGYPSIYAGCHWGTCSSNQHGMPMLVSQIASAPSAWNVTPAPNGAWDIAYDIWFNTTATTSGAPNGLELMVWLNHTSTIQPAGSQVASGVSIDGMSWNVWYGGGGSGAPVVSYVLTSPTNAVNFDLISFFRDAMSRGYLNTAWYLIDVEAGTEIWTGGGNFQTDSFSVSVSSGLAAPSNLSASAQSTSQINLSWSASSGASSYDVFRSTTSGFSASSANQIASGVSTASYSDTGLNAGTTYYYLVEACNSAGCSGPSNQASATTLTSSGGGGGFPAPVSQIAAGSTAGGCGSISPFSSDEYFSGGTAVCHNNSINTSHVIDPAPQGVYQYERYGTSNFTYTVPNLTPGSAYWVRLHFAETYFTSTGQREFNVTINGNQVLTNFDIVAAAGGANTAVVEMFQALANGSGQIVIGFNVGAVNYPKIDGIEIIPVSTPSYQISGGSTAGGCSSISPYASDEYFSGGSAVCHNNSISTSHVVNAAPLGVYQYERYGTSNFTYTIPNLTPGADYAVRLHFAETYFTSTGQREFNVTVNGVQVLTNFDILAAAGAANTAVARTFTATANSNGQIVLGFNLGAVNYPKVDGIEVIPQ